ncbi:MAG: four helix bundle protein [Saprospiraceae bacterium]|nr:four helix bundle protein [Saprospiraceae bacterium]
MWQESRIAVSKIYKATASFPREEQFGLTSQVSQDIVSVASNIAEGEARLGQRTSYVFSDCLFQFNGSIRPIDHGNRLTNAAPDTIEELKVDIGSLSNKINALYNYRKEKKGGNG